jgi:hypothetical protein
MAREASTSVRRRATPVRAIRRDAKESQRVKGRLLLIVLAIVALIAVAGLGYLGLNPPNPASKPVEKVLPNDRFQAH